MKIYIAGFYFSLGLANSLSEEHNWQYIIVIGLFSWFGAGIILGMAIKKLMKGI